MSRNGALQHLLYLGGPLKTLTLGNNEALIDLWCSYTLVTQLDLSHAPNLELLGVERSDLTFLDLSANPRLTDVMAGDNQLLALRAGPAAPTAVLDGQRPVEVQLADGQTSFDLAQLGVPIDPAHISGVTGAQLEGSVLTGLSDGSLVTYRYTDGPFSFTASLQFRVSNAWVEPLTIDDWTYGEAAHPPTPPPSTASRCTNTATARPAFSPPSPPPKRAPGMCGSRCPLRTATPALWR